MFNTAVGNSTYESVSISVEAPRIEDSKLIQEPRGRFRRAIAFIWKLTLGVAACQNLFTSILVVGWTYRLSQRSAVKAWWKRSPYRESGNSFRRFACNHEGFERFERYPNWILGQESSKNQSLIPKTMGRVFGSLGWNIKVGVKGALNTYVLTILPCLILLSSWYSGWNNSFNKGYEQALVGPLSGIIGIVLFIAVMFYLPMAQARQAVTGEGAPFYHFRDNRRLIRIRWHFLIILAFAYSALGAGVMLMNSFPSLIPSAMPEVLEYSTPDQLVFLKRYFIACGFFIFPAYVLLRCWAARIYASGLLRAYERGLISFGNLRPFEQEMFQRLQLDQSSPELQARWLSVRTRQWFLSFPGRALTGFFAILLWFALIAETYVAQFFNYQHVVRWLNHPLIQLPWYQNIPQHLIEDAKED